MAAIKSKNTSPEIKVRKLMFSAGYRFRLNNKSFPGKPDLVFKKYKTVIFVHGCFWHSHNNCKRSNFPKSNQEYWTQKIARNVERDKVNFEKIKALGWTPIIVWECEIKDIENIKIKLSKYFSKLTQSVL